MTDQYNVITWAKYLTESCKSLILSTTTTALSDAIHKHNRSASVFLKTIKHTRISDWKNSLRTYLGQKYG